MNGWFPAAKKKPAYTESFHPNARGHKALVGALPLSFVP